MKDYRSLATKIIEKIGGKDNVSRCVHCYTRLRFNLKDESVIDLDELKKLDVLGVQFKGNQLQLVIGNDVIELYDEVCSQLGIEKEEGLDIKEDDQVVKAKKKITVKSIFNSLIDVVVGCMVPILPALIGGGLLRALLSILMAFGVLTQESSTYATLNFIADAPFYFMPVLIGGFAAKKFNVNIVMGIVMGAVMLHPTFTAAQASGTPLSVFGINIFPGNYASSVIPVILSVYVLSLIDRLLVKFTPKCLRTVINPLLEMLVVIPLALCFVAPIGFILSQALGNAIAFLYAKLGFIIIGLLAAFMPWLIMTGMHFGLIPLSFQSIQTSGQDFIMLPAAILSNVSQGAACLAVGLKAKNADTKALALSSSFSNLVPGISEPGMFGITLRYKTPMYAAMIGSLVGGLYIGLMKVGPYVFTIPNLFGLGGFIQAGSNNLLHMIIALVIGFVVTFIATMILYKEKEN